MALSRTFAEIKRSIRLRGGWVNSARVTEELLGDIVNEALTELWDTIVGKWADYYTVNTIQLATIGNQQIFAAVNWYKVRKLERDRSGAAATGEWEKVQPTSLDGEHLYRDALRYRYYLRDSKIWLTPTPTVADRLRLHYITPAPLFATDSDSFDGINGYESILVQKGKLAVESELKLDTANSLRRVMELEARIRTAADAQDASEPFYLDPRGPMTRLEEGDEWA
jgi:hypothetical protein